MLYYAMPPLDPIPMRFTTPCPALEAGGDTTRGLF